MDTLQPLPHFHKEDRISEKDLIPDGDFVSVVPDWPALEGLEVSYLSGATFRRYKMISGVWRQIGSTDVSTLLSGVGVDVNAKVFYWPFAENAIQTAYWTSTVGGTGANTFPLDDSFGYVKSACSGVAFESVEMYTKAKVQPVTFPTLVLEYELMTTTNFSGNKVDLGIGMNAAAGQYPGFVNHSFGYVWDHTTQSYNFVTQSSSALSDAGVTGLTTNTWHRLRFEFISGVSLKCFLDGVQIGTTHTTNLPSNTTQLATRWIIGSLAGNVTARDLLVRSVRLAMIP